MLSIQAKTFSFFYSWVKEMSAHSSMFFSFNWRVNDHVMIVCMFTVNFTPHMFSITRWIDIIDSYNILSIIPRTLCIMTQVSRDFQCHLLSFEIICVKTIIVLNTVTSFFKNKKLNFAFFALLNSWFA